MKYESRLILPCLCINWWGIILIFKENNYTYLLINNTMNSKNRLVNQD